jgi:ribosomal protein L31E
LIETAQEQQVLSSGDEKSEAENPASQEQEVTTQQTTQTVEEKEAPKQEVKQKEKPVFTLERDYVVPFRHVYWLGRTNRAKRAINLLRKFVKKHLKTDDVVIDGQVNQLIWARSIEKPPRRITIHVGLTKEKKAYVYLPAKGEHSG